MKKLFSLALTFMKFFGLVACANNDSEENSTSSEPEATMDSEALIVYFSWSGNTESVANEIAHQTGADIFEIIPEESYTDDYDALLDIAKKNRQIMPDRKLPKPLRTLNNMMWCIWDIPTGGAICR